MVIPSIDVVPGSANRPAAVGASIAHVAAQVILGDLVSPALIPATTLSNLSTWPTLAAPLPLPLPRLSTLPLPPWLSALLSGLATPPLLTRLLSGLAPRRTLSPRRQRLNLIAESFHVVQRSRLVAALRLTLPGFARA